MPSLGGLDVLLHHLAGSLRLASDQRLLDVASAALHGADFDGTHGRLHLAGHLLPEPHHRGVIEDGAVDAVLQLAALKLEPAQVAGSVVLAISCLIAE